MINLHNLKGAIVGQVFKDLYSANVMLLASNYLQTSGCQWQSLVKFRTSGPSAAPAKYSFGLNLHDSAIKEPYTFELSEGEARGKLRAWGYSAVDADKLINTNLEVE